jgi:hypothetical protein
MRIFVAVLKPAIFVFALVAFSLVNLHAQSQIQGRIIDSNKIAVSQANVMLLQAHDSSLVKASMSDKEGSYSFNNIAAGRYLVMAAFVGYSRTYSQHLLVDENKSVVNVDPLTLTETVATLAEVAVTAKKPLLEQKIDRLVVNVANSITSAGSTALQVLERSPGVVVNRQSSSISILGKDGVKLMINGKITYMPASAIFQMLDGMSAGNIDKIELITTPPASLDA